MGVAAVEVARAAQTGNFVLAIGRTGRPASWCESLLGDLVAQRNLEVVDDEMAAAPAWINSGGSNGVRNSTSAEILDPQFALLAAPGGEVVDGYVTLRWRQQRTLVVRTRPGCFQSDPGVVRCSSMRYQAIDVHDDEMSQACNFQLYGRAYWPQWKDTSIEIRASLR
ncbi:MAG: hypothetical protein ABI605_18730 [Rhizobacter sp.]